jgi:crossover junction endodeoxyribonuclease RuvC
MFERRVLGVDPGMAAVGLAVIDDARQPVIVWAQTLRTPSGLAQEARLHRLYTGIRQAIRTHRPSVMALERLMWGRNTESAMGVARASGVVMLAAAEAGIQVEEYAPLEVKMAVTGVGNATKETVRHSLSRLIGILGVPQDPDAADAVAVAVCHLQQARMRRVTREAASVR